MLGARPMRFKAVRIMARSSAALGGISLNAHSHATVLRSTRNIISERVLKMPRERTGDKDKPLKDFPRNTVA